MKKYLLITLLIISTAAVAFAGSIEDELKQLAEDQLVEEATPIVEAFHSLINQSLYHNAAAHGLPGFDIGVKAMYLQIPDDKQTGLLETADVAVLALPVLQGSIGLLHGFQVTGRFFTADLGDAGKLTLYGGGARFELNEIVDIPLVAPKVAVQYFYNHFALGDVATSGSSSFDLIVSKKLFVIEPYAGVGFSTTTMAFDYSLEDLPVPVDITADIETNSTRMAFGLNWIPLPLVRFNVEYSLLSGYTPQASAGLIISFL
jgi:hypothetical protein